MRNSDWHQRHSGLSDGPSSFKFTAPHSGSEALHSSSLSSFESSLISKSESLVGMRCTVTGTTQACLRRLHSGSSHRDSYDSFRVRLSNYKLQVAKLAPVGPGPEPAHCQFVSESSSLGAAAAIPRSFKFVTIISSCSSSSRPNTM